MAPPIKYFITVFIVFYILSYNGCLANKYQACVQEIDKFFENCTKCKAKDESVKVKGYLDHVLFFSVKKTIMTTSHLSPFVQNIIGKMKPESNENPRSPVQFCNEKFPGNKNANCQDAMQYVFGSYYTQRNYCVQYAYDNLSIIGMSMGSYTVPLDAYMKHISESTQPDSTDLSSGTNVQKFCMSLPTSSQESSKQQQGRGGKAQTSGRLEPPAFAP